MDTRRQVESYVCAGTGRDVLGGLCQRDVQRVVDVAAERGDCGPRFVERALRGRGDAGERTMLAGALDERAHLADDERELLRQSVVQVARNAPPLAGRGSLGQLLLPRSDLARGAERQHQVEAEPEQ